jgi:phasin
MTATYHPQAAAAEARANYREVTARLSALGFDTAFPEAARAFAESTVAQAREAYDRSTGAFEVAVDTMQKSFDAAGQGAVALNRKILEIAQRNVSSGFDLTKSLAGAKNLADFAELQTAYWQKQLDALTAQAEEVRELSTKVTADTAEPIKAHMARGADELRRAH